MSINSLFKLSQLDGLLDRRLGELQNSRVTRHQLRRAPDLKTYTSPRYTNWLVTRGVTIFVNKEPLLSRDTVYTMPVSKEVFTFVDVDGNFKQQTFAINALGQVIFDKPLSPDDEVMADFSFRMQSQEDIHRLLYAGLMDVGRRMYRQFDPAAIPAAVADMVVTAALLEFYSGQATDSSALYNYKIQEQTHDKSQVAENVRENIKRLDDKLLKDAKMALWQIGNGKARSVVSVKQHYSSSAARGGYDGVGRDRV